MKFKTIDNETIPKYFDNKTKELLWSDYWIENGIHDYDPKKTRKQTFVVDTPPPTVSGSLHLGHVFSYSHTDFIVRYQRMKGKNIFYPMGWDDNGLPTERRVQSYFNVKCDAKVQYVENFLETFQPSKETLNISRQNFIELCNKLTYEDEKVFKKIWQQLGLSVDWKQEYATIDNKSRKIAQYSFLDLYNKNRLYTSTAPIMWDVDFQTSIAQAEIEDRETKGEMFKISFYESDLENSFKIATTRPELIPACVGVVVNPDDPRYKHLIGKSVVTPLFGVTVPVITSNLVDIDKGTGIVMVCTFGDLTDINWWKENQLLLRQVIGANGRMLPISFGESGWECINSEQANFYYSKLIGKTVFSAKKEIIELLKNEKPHWQKTAALEEEPVKVERMVKYYEKGDKPLEFIPSRQWFVRILGEKQKFLEAADEIIWNPSFAKTRFVDWTKNLAFDWNISRQRYFGVPIPVWYPINENGVIGFTRPILPESSKLPIDPAIDVPPGYEESQRNKTNGFTGETDVFDTWFTSSLTPQLSSGWFTDIERHKKLFPADIRPQSHEIIRTWTFYTVVKSYLHEGVIPWDRVIISGWILDPDRKKMSKSKGNVETPESWISQYSSDGVRYWAAKAKIGVDTVFDTNVMKNGSRLVTKLFNAGKFVLSQKSNNLEISDEIDLAMVNELRALIKKSTKHFQNFDHASALQEIETFFWHNFTDRYLELAKNRASNISSVDFSGQDSAVATLRLTLNVLLRLFAPFLPFITEEIWSWCFSEEQGEKSIHKAKWPNVKELSHINKPKYRSSFKKAMELMDGIKKFKTLNGISFSSEINFIKIPCAKKEEEVINEIIGDLKSYGKIKDYAYVRKNAKKYNTENYLIPIS